MDDDWSGFVDASAAPGAAPAAHGSRAHAPPQPQPHYQAPTSSYYTTHHAIQPQYYAAYPPGGGGQPVPAPGPAAGTGGKRAVERLQLSRDERATFDELWLSSGAGMGENLGAADAAALLRTSKLSDAVLGQIWNIADDLGRGSLDRDQFFVALKLTAIAQHKSRGGVATFSHVEQSWLDEFGPSAIPPPHLDVEAARTTSLASGSSHTTSAQTASMQGTSMYPAVGPQQQYTTGPHAAHAGYPAALASSSTPGHDPVWTPSNSVQEPLSLQHAAPGPTRGESGYGSESAAHGVPYHAPLDGVAQGAPKQTCAPAAQERHASTAGAVSEPNQSHTIPSSAPTGASGDPASLYAQYGAAHMQPVDAGATAGFDTSTMYANVPHPQFPHGNVSYSAEAVHQSGGPDTGEDDEFGDFSAYEDVHSSDTRGESADTLPSSGALPSSKEARVCSSEPSAGPAPRVAALDAFTALIGRDLGIESEREWVVDTADDEQLSHEGAGGETHRVHRSTPDSYAPGQPGAEELDLPATNDTEAVESSAVGTSDDDKGDNGSGFGGFVSVGEAAPGGQQAPSLPGAHVAPHASGGAASAQAHASQRPLAFGFDLSLPGPPSEPSQKESLVDRVESGAEEDDEFGDFSSFDQSGAPPQGGEAPEGRAPLGKTERLSAPPAQDTAAPDAHVQQEPVAFHASFEAFETTSAGERDESLPTSHARDASSSADGVDQHSAGVGDDAIDFAEFTAAADMVSAPESISAFADFANAVPSRQAQGQPAPSNVPEMSVPAFSDSRSTPTQEDDGDFANFSSFQTAALPAGESGATLAGGGFESFGAHANEPAAVPADLRSAGAPNGGARVPYEPLIKDRSSSVSGMSILDADAVDAWAVQRDEALRMAKLARTLAKVLTTISDAAEAAVQELDDDQVQEVASSSKGTGVVEAALLVHSSSVMCAAVLGELGVQSASAEGDILAKDLFSAAMSEDSRGEADDDRGDEDPATVCIDAERACRAACTRCLTAFGDARGAALVRSLDAARTAVRRWARGGGGGQQCALTRFPLDLADKVFEHVRPSSCAFGGRSFVVAAANVWLRHVESVLP